MDKEKKNMVDNQEDFILKKIRYYQGTIDDYDTFWKKKIAEGEKEESPETKSFTKRNADLNKAFEIIPVEKDDTVICKDVVSGKDTDDKPSENADVKPTEKEEGGKDVKKDGKKKEKKEVKEKDEEKEEKCEDDKKKKK